MNNDEQLDDIVLLFIMAIYMPEFGIKMNGILGININQ
jgi:hypothetical protein